MDDRSVAESIHWFADHLPARISDMNTMLESIPESGELTVEQECSVILKVGDVLGILNSILNRISDEA